MQSECEPICKNHYLPLTHFCFYSCERVCSQCVTDNACCAAHPRSVLPEQHLTRNLLLYLEKLPQAVDSAFQRHAELGALASEARKQIKNSQDALLQIAINVMQA